MGEVGGGEGVVGVVGVVKGEGEGGGEGDLDRGGLVLVETSFFSTFFVRDGDGDRERELCCLNVSPRSSLETNTFFSTGQQSNERVRHGFATRLRIPVPKP
jgi:hypothetical protein